MNVSFYNAIKEIMISARNKVYQTANFAMVEAYWNIGKSIIEEQGGNEKAEYGTGLLKECLVYNKNTQNCRGDSPKLQREIPQ